MSFILHLNVLNQMTIYKTRMTIRRNCSLVLSKRFPILLSNEDISLNSLRHCRQHSIIEIYPSNDRQ